MELLEVTWRHRNDFHWQGRCRHCSHTERYRDGYADAFYCRRVVPERHCPACGLNCYGAPVNPPSPTNASGTGDPEANGSVKP